MSRVLILLLLCSACSPLNYVRRAPIQAPNPIEAPALTVPTLLDEDCGRFLLEDGQWVEYPWAQSEASLEVILPGDSHPAVGVDGRAQCRSVTVAPGWYVVAREARDRYPAMRDQIDIWADYSERAAERHQEESEEIAELLRMARRRQLEAAAVGSLVGGSLASGIILAVVLLAN